jgi:hypothetical protein
LGYDPSTKTQAEQIQTVANELGIPADIKQSLAERFDVVFIVLGEDYLLATGDALSSLPRDTTAFAFAAKGTKDLIGDCQWVRSTAKEREALSTVWTELKGQQLQNVATNVTTAEELQALTSERVRELSILSQSSG